MTLPVFALLAITLTLSFFVRVPVGDTGVYATYAKAMAHGAWPYRGQPLEYPPGVLPFLLLPVPLCIVGRINYTVGFALLSGACLWLLLWDIARANGSRAALLAMGFALLFGRFIFFQLDIFAAAALYGAVRTMKAGRLNWSAILFAAAILIKAYPAVCLPALVCFLPRTKRWRYIAVAGAALFVGVLPFLVTAPGGLWHSVTYHSGRPPEIMSLAAAAGFVLHIFGEPARVMISHASLTLVFRYANLFGTLSDGILAGGWIVLAAALWRAGQCGRAGINCLMLLVLFIIFFKVGSPQFLLSALCMLPFVASELRGRSLRWPLIALMATCMGAVILLDFTANINHISMLSGLLIVARLVVEGWLLWWALRQSDAGSVLQRWRRRATAAAGLRCK